MDDFFNPPTGGSSSSDPAADFLARERAALGESFGTGDAPSTGGGGAAAAEKDYERSASAFPDLDDDGVVASTTGGGGTGPRIDDFDEDDDDLDFLGGGGTKASNVVSVTNHTELSAFEQEYPEVELPSETQNGYGSSFPQQTSSIFPQQQTQTTSSIFSNGATANGGVEPDSEFIQSWRVKQKEEIARREETSKAKREETIVKAQNAIDNFYKEYNAKKEKNIAANKEEETAFNAAQTDALAKGTTWERIAALVELNDSRSKTTTKSKQDLNRFKEVLLSLKREGENAPGAAGY